MRCFVQKPNAAKVSSMFAGTREKCFGCKNTVYPTEKVKILLKENKHKHIFWAISFNIY